METYMKIIKQIGAILVLILGTATTSIKTAEAAGCLLQNIDFVSIISDGTLIINAEEVGDGATGLLINAPYCNVNTPTNGISVQVCHNWYQAAVTAMLSNKRIFFSLPGNVCPTGNPGADPPVAIHPPLTGLSYFGIRP